MISKCFVGRYFTPDRFFETCQVYRKETCHVNREAAMEKIYPSWRKNTCHGRENVRHGGN